MKAERLRVILLGGLWIYYVGLTLSQTTTTKITKTTRCRQNQRCSYRISKLVETEYNIVRNIMENLVSSHWNVTLEFVNLYMDTNLKSCDQYIDNMAVDKVLARDFRHPNALFRALDDDNRTNLSVREQYESEWFEKYKMIRPKLQPQSNKNKCNALGLKLHALLYQYPERVNNSNTMFKCNSARNDETLASTLIDFYISQSFMKSCLGNLELLAMSIRRILKFDCERAHKFKIAYFTSKYLNMFRTCDPYLTVSDLMTDSSITCTNKELNGTINRKYCSWYEIVCKYPSRCLTLLKPDQHHDEQMENLTNDSFVL